MTRLHVDLFARMLANSVENHFHLHRGAPCWDWTAYRTPRGYGRITVRVAGKEHPQGMWAHRVMAGCVLDRELHPDEETVEHECTWPWCISPWHLSIGSRGDNTRDMWARRRDRPRKTFRLLLPPDVYGEPDPLVPRCMPTPRLLRTGTDDCPF